MFTRFTSLAIIAIVAVACVLGFAPASWAQDTATAHSMTGCLRNGGAPNTYIISNREHGAPRAMSIVSSSAGLDLAAHLGQRVQITGTLVPAKEAEADPNVPKAFNYMNVTAIKTISATCP
ncbi:MAG: hypothetical protein ABSE85_17310 [Candidatus Korobacteraceae bacterium]|jgi:hypothetical protein